MCAWPDLALDKLADQHEEAIQLDAGCWKDDARYTPMVTWIAFQSRFRHAKERRTYVHKAPISLQFVCLCPK